MPRPPSRPVFVIIPGASQSPSHYAHLIQLLHLSGYPTFTAILPSAGTGEKVTAQDDTEYVRSKMLLPILDGEKHDVIIVMHSYSGVPGSAAALGLGKAERLKQGRGTSVLGQIFIAAILARGGDGRGIIEVFGGSLPPHLGVNEAAGLITCSDPGPPLYGDVTPQSYQDSFVLSTFCPSLESFKSPCPRASWDSDDFRGRCAFIRTINDQAVPFALQNMLIEGTGQEWIKRDIETGHNAQIVAPEELCGILVELGKGFKEI